MIIVADESVDQSIIDRLRHDGHAVVAIVEENPGVDDEAVLERANRDDSVLLTADKDFGELVYRLGKSHCGIILVRLDGLESIEKAETVSAAFQDHGEDFRGSFSVVSAANLRIRRPN